MAPPASSMHRSRTAPRSRPCWRPTKSGPSCSKRKASPSPARASPMPSAPWCCGRPSRMVEDGPAVLKHGDFNKLAIANPKLAPYGEASIETLEALGLKTRWSRSWSWARTSPRPTSSSIPATPISASSRCRRSWPDGEIIKGSGWIVPDDMHEPIRQDAVMLRAATDKPAVSALLEFLQGDKAGR
jgi:hypothetical protein